MGKQLLYALHCIVRNKGRKIDEESEEEQGISPTETI
jgi:hypothetical protein